MNTNRDQISTKRKPVETWGSSDKPVSFDFKSSGIIEGFRSGQVTRPESSKKEMQLEPVETIEYSSRKQRPQSSNRQHAGKSNRAAFGSSAERFVQKQDP